MTITSYIFFGFLVFGAFFYYILPKAFQWIWLLILSIVFYMLSATPYTFIYIIISTLLAWFATNFLEKYRVDHGPLSENRTCKIYIFSSIIITILLWFIIKGTPFVNSSQYFLSKIFSKPQINKPFSFIASLGMGYYTLQLIGYTLDCYWGNAKVQTNIFKVLLFTAFFPQLITGPISRYTQLSTIFEKHKFSYINLAHGSQRILWGLYKKIVLAERVGIIVNAIWSDYVTSYGLYTWIAMLLYPVQMYADFSGCMDIVIGTAEIFDIKLAENFKNPFRSKSSQEFWQRWHITLGTWAKDYVLYPLLKSNTMVKLGKKLKKTFGKKRGKFLATSIGMLVLWIVMGVWHGAFKYVIGVSLWYWIVLMLGELTAPYFEIITQKLNFKTKSFGWTFFQCARTYLIYAIGAVFFRANGIQDAIQFIKALFTTFKSRNWNPWIFFDGSLFKMGISRYDLSIIIISIFLMLIVGILREKYDYARNWLDMQPILFRWVIYIILLFAVMIWGKYGPGYNASAFIYGNF